LNLGTDFLGFCGILVCDLMMLILLGLSYSTSVYTYFLSLMIFLLFLGLI